MLYVRYFFLIFLVMQPLFAGQKCFVIDICSYNNRQWYEKNLSSVFNQNYQNYRVVYTNDCSCDGTGQLVEDYVRKFGHDRVKIVHNKERQRMLANHWRVIHGCDDDEIIVHLDGDDWFAHDNVLNKLNEVYQDENVWITYGSYQFWPSLEKYDVGLIPQEVIDNGSYRKTHFRKSAYHLRTFHAWLAKQIKLRDLLFDHKPFEGQFIPAISDWALLYPMFEMAGGRFKYIPEVLYNFNVINPLNHDKDKNQLRLQTKCASYICRKKPYKRLEKPIVVEKEIEDKAMDIVIISTDEALTKKLESSIYKYIQGFGVIYRVQSADEVGNLKYLSSYVLILPDEVKVIKKFDLSVCCAMLKKTQASTFYFNDLRSKAFVYLENGIAAIKMHKAKKSSLVTPCIFPRDKIGLNVYKEHVGIFFLDQKIIL